MERLTAEDYFREAFDVLARNGSEALTIAALCDRLEITKGSFYHHFGGMPGFTTALLTFWESEHSDRLIALSRAVPDPALRITTLTDLAVGLPHGPEAAIRAWGRSSPEVAANTARIPTWPQGWRRDGKLSTTISRGPARPRPRARRS